MFTQLRLEAFDIATSETGAHIKLHQLPSLQHIGQSLQFLEFSLAMHFKENSAQNFNFLMKIK